MVLKLILSNTDNLSRYLQGEQMDVITAKKTADAVVKTLSNCRNEESFTQMWSHADVIAQKIRIGIEGTKFTFRDAKVPQTRPSRRRQGLTDETPAAANDSSQQTAHNRRQKTVKVKFVCFMDNQTITPEFQISLFLFSVACAAINHK